LQAAPLKRPEHVDFSRNFSQNPVAFAPSGQHWEF
jgi:hypothetical protein